MWFCGQWWLDIACITCKLLMRIFLDWGQQIHIVKFKLLCTRCSGTCEYNCIHVGAICPCRKHWFICTTVLLGSGDQVCSGWVETRGDQHRWQGCTSLLYLPCLVWGWPNSLRRLHRLAYPSMACYTSIMPLHRKANEIKNRLPRRRVLQVLCNKENLPSLPVWFVYRSIIRIAVRVCVCVGGGGGTIYQLCLCLW